jgi:hypothetical protein
VVVVGSDVQAVLRSYRSIGAASRADLIRVVSRPILTLYQG